MFFNLARGSLFGGKTNSANCAPSRFRRNFEMRALPSSSSFFCRPESHKWYALSAQWLRARAHTETPINGHDGRSNADRRSFCADAPRIITKKMTWKRLAASNKPWLIRRLFTYLSNPRVSRLRPERDTSCNGRSPPFRRLSALKTRPLHADRSSARRIIIRETDLGVQILPDWPEIVCTEIDWS